MDGLFRRIEQLACYPAPAELWETEVFPGRLRPYDSSWMDSIVQQSDLRWIGIGKRRVALCFEPDLDLLRDEDVSRESIEDGLDRLFLDPAARYDFWLIAD